MIEVTEICRRIVVRLKGERKIGETVYMITKKITRARNTPDSRYDNSSRMRVRAVSPRGLGVGVAVIWTPCGS